MYEKNSFAGGRCGQIVRDGHRFDMGATMMLMPDVYRDIFRSLGMTLENELKVKPLDDIYTVYFSDGTSLAFSKDRERMNSQLEKLEPGELHQSLKNMSPRVITFIRWHLKNSSAVTLPGSLISSSSAMLCFLLS
ncbi:MAG: FAD-dependent oxidoreductase [Marinilabiliales bacterium]|nr:FAD-dependent oxidoreductase [Marinilabiliales bacterium]